MRTALYLRVSTTEQAKEGYSLGAQKHKLVNFCELKGWNIVEIYSDEGISGSSLKERPQAMKMLNDAKKKNFENILILKVDRLCRNTRDLLEIVDLLKRYNVRLNAVDEQIDYTTPVGKMMLTLLGSFAELERSTIAERMKSGREQKVRTGIKSKTGKILFGYDYIEDEYVINEDQANVVRLIYNKIIEGNSIRSIARYLVDNKIANFEGKKWNASIVKRLVINPTYKGYTFSSLYRHPAKYVDFENAILEKASNVEPIVSEETYEHANSIINVRTNGNTRKYAKSDFYFADVAYCNNCGWKLYSKSAKNHYGPERRKYYKCYYNQSNLEKICNFTSIENGVLEELFLKYLENLQINWNEAEEPTDKKLIEENQMLLENLYLNRDKVKQRKEKLLEKLLDGLIEDEQFTSTSAMLSDELEDLENKIKEIQEKESNNSNTTNSFKEFKESLAIMNLTVRELWSRLTDDQKRIFVSTLVKKILVSKGKIETIEFN